MATAAGSTPAPIARARFVLRNWFPWAGLAVWFAGGYAIWHVGGRAGWSVGAFLLAAIGWTALFAVAARDVVRGMFGPVFVYEITRLGRRKLTFVLRLVYVLFVLGLLGTMYLTWLEDVGYFDYRSSATVPTDKLSNFATRFFATFVGLQYCVVGFLTPAYVAGSIADEKERKTLEFLLATDLRNREIVFGKLAARVTVLVMFVLAGLPIVAFLQLFGGIDPELLLAGTAATLVTVLGLSAVSVYFSVMLKRPRDAIALTYLAAAVYLVASGLLATAAKVYQMTTAAAGGLGVWDLGGGIVVDWSQVIDAVVDGTDLLAAGNLGYAFLGGLFARAGGFSPAAIVDALFRYGAFWSLVTAVCLGVGVARLRAVALAQAYGGPRRRRGHGRGGKGARERPPVGDDPVFWKEVFADGGVRGGCVGWVMSVLILVLVFAVPVVMTTVIFGDLFPFVGHLFQPSYFQNKSAGQRWEDYTHGINVWARIATGLLGSIVLLAVAVRGAGAVSGERDRDTWVSLIATPLTAWEMVRGKWLGCVLGVRRAYATLLLVWAVALVCGAAEPVMIAATAVALAVYVSAFAWIGILCSITSRTTLVATVRTIMIAVFLGGGFWFFLGLCCAMPLSLLRVGGRVDVVDDVAQILLGWTPPFVLGWLPLHKFERGDLGPFAWEERDGIGPLSPVFGLLVWSAAAVLFGVLSWLAFQRASNRGRDTLADHLPKPPQTRHPASTDAANPST